MVLGALALVALVVYLFDVLLLFFGAALLAIVFRVPSEWLGRKLGIDARWTLVFVLLVLAGLVTLGAWLIGGALAEQFSGLSQRIPATLQTARERLADLPLLGRVASEATQSSFRILGHGMQAITTTFGAIASFVLLLFVAVLFALQPQMYVRGALHLLPKSARQRGREVFDEVCIALERWILGQLALMTLVGTLTYIGYRAVGLEFAGALAFIAGLLTFIPFLGSFIGGLVALIVALTQGPTITMYVAGIYLAVQLIENACEPFVQQRAVYLAPALLLFAQVTLGALAGALGTVFATPLAAALIVVVKMLYIQDALGDRAVSPRG